MAVLLPLQKRFPHKEVSIEKDTELRVNDNIVVSEVRLIDQNGLQAGVVPITKALDMARQARLDLVEIAPTATPVVCKILDYGKYKYQESKKRHQARVRQKQVEMKEIKFHLVISESDYAVKLKNAQRFLEAGNRVKVSWWFRGREISKVDIAMRTLERFVADLDAVADMEQKPNLEGKRLQMLLTPKKNRSTKNAKDEDK